MTITTTRTTEEYVGDGSQNTWPITFPFFEGSDIKACIVNNAGEQVDLTYGTDYTVELSSGSIGGTLYYTLDDGAVLTIWLSLPITQETDFYNTGPLNAEVLEDSFDRLTLIAQQLQEESDRSIKVATTSTETPEELLADLYAGRDAAITSASAAATSEANAAVSASAAATSATNAATSASNAASSAVTAQAWAESEMAPDPNDAESKSAKSWALAASDAVPIASSTYAGKIMASASLTVNQTTGEATVPAATEALAGIVERATDDEASAGTDTTRYVTPYHLHNYASCFIGQWLSLRNTTPPTGYYVRNGALIENASIAVPKLWAYLQEEANTEQCITQTEWDTMQAATYTLSDDDETEVPIWDGVGGVPFYVLDTDANTLRLPDTRGMYSEDAGFDGLAVGGAHGDMIQNITGNTRMEQDSYVPSGAFVVASAKEGAMSGGGTTDYPLLFDASRVVPTGNVNKPRAFGMLPCIYTG